MVAIWGRAWRSRVSSTARAGGNGDDGSGPVHPTSGGSSSSSSTTGTGYTTSTTTCTTTSDPGGDQGQLDFHQHINLLTAPVEEENAEELEEERLEELEEERLEDLEERAKELEEERVKKLQHSLLKKKLQHIKGLVVEFCGENGNNNLGALERWLSELEVSWVLHLGHLGESAPIFLSLEPELQYRARSWIMALFEIKKSIFTCLEGWYSLEGATVGVGPPPASEFIRFVQATLLKMLPFVEAIVAVAISGPNNGQGRVVAPAEEKLQALIDVREALSTTSEHILSPLYSSLYLESADLQMRDLLSAELLAKLDQAIWDTMDKTRTGLLSSPWGTPRSPNIHKVTRSVINYIKVLWANHGSLNRILHDAFLRGEYVHQIEYVSHLTNLIIEIAHSLEESLARKSQSSFQNQSLRFLFLINNSYFIRQQLHAICPLGLTVPDLTPKIDDYINVYLQVSWAPVLKCLHNPTPLCFRRKRESHSALLEFESEFQKTYTAQKLWKVPDPELSKGLRKAIIQQSHLGLYRILGG